MSSSTPPPPSDGGSQPYPHTPYDPWAHPPAAGHGDKQAGTAGATDTSGSGSTEVRELLLVALAVAVPGVVLGLLWWWLAGPVPYISDGERAFLRYTEGEETIGVDGVFVVLAGAMGVLSGLLVFLARRHGGLAVVIGLALGSTLASVLGWQLGQLLGPSDDLAARAAEAGRGGTFQGPLELNGTIGLLVWPLCALLAHLLVTALFGPRDEQPSPPEFPGWAAAPPQGWPAQAPATGQPASPAAGGPAAGTHGVREPYGGHQEAPSADQLPGDQPPPERPSS